MVCDNFNVAPPTMQAVAANEAYAFDTSNCCGQQMWPQQYVVAVMVPAQAQWGGLADAQQGFASQPGSPTCQPVAWQGESCQAQLCQTAPNTEQPYIMQHQLHPNMQLQLQQLQQLQPQFFMLPPPQVMNQQDLPQPYTQEINGQEPPQVQQMTVQHAAAGAASVFVAAAVPELHSQRNSPASSENAELVPGDKPEAAVLVGHSTSAGRRLRRKRACLRANHLELCGAADDQQGGNYLESPSSSRPQGSLAAAAGAAWNHHSEQGGHASHLRCDELQRQLADGNQFSVAIELRGQIWALSQDAAGCRLVQLAFENCNQREATQLAQELRGHVQDAVTSPHANYVLQKVVTQFTSIVSSFVADELLGVGARVARNRYGCRILCRLLEFNASMESTILLVDEVLQEAADLCRHSFGHHVVQSILEHGKARHKKQVVLALCSDPLGNAKHRCASYLVEKALSYANPADQQLLAQKLEAPEILAELALSQCGCFVARTLLLRSVDNPNTQAAVARIQGCLQEAKETKNGLWILQELADRGPIAA
ncbi:unnamed protein product [Polarella glacialis]|uniref:PUM-HD domain-containing protein n=1 Tax=Polarella glacialis TaxID=89957 RepID=A0A813ELN8_POLGL|nr:unnamed protein product [Polarella glacialis]